MRALKLVASDGHLTPFGISLIPKPQQTKLSALNEAIETFAEENHD